ncbi:hypothetical protein QR680_017013 [Steinernema hermaphroditum]|uniref:AB hydrolase-1 domain-containing protein n=1 Tax=Steinernema hermaphroditum TaxID=289476 RepID=A0AA39HF09_9BILA|nr:hypothetical protein QR680_017013 [Steinernema hermaphroditum]
MRLAVYALTRGALTASLVSVAAREGEVATRAPCLRASAIARNMSIAAETWVPDEKQNAPEPILPKDYDPVLCLRREKIEFSFGGHKFHVDSVIQDTHPQGSNVGTVVAVHGSPGSHKDFKYVTPLLKESGIRFIGINFPGYGHTEGENFGFNAQFLGAVDLFLFCEIQFMFLGNCDERLIQDNTERVAYVQAVIDHLELKRNLVFLGHSRGTENALKMAALNSEKTVGLVNANFIGIRTHQGIKPTWIIDFADFLWQLGWTRWFLRPILFYAYNNILKLRVPNPEVAAWSLSGMVPWKVDLPGQEVFVDKLNRSGVKSLLVYAGKDPLIEPEISKQFVELFDGNVHFESDTKAIDDEAVRRQVIKSLEAGSRSVAVYFKNEDHFLQKHQARLLVEGICTMLAKEQ